MSWKSFNIYIKWKFNLTSCLGMSIAEGYKTDRYLIILLGKVRLLDISIYWCLEACVKYTKLFFSVSGKILMSVVNVSLLFQTLNIQKYDTVKIIY